MPRDTAMSQPAAALSRTEFIALMAMMTAIVAFSIDAMLPSLPQIAQELTPDAPNRAQLILTSFVMGMGVGTLIAGPLSDAFGRKPIVMMGAGLYCVGALAAWLAPTLETLLLARVVQGLGAAGPRVVTLAITRDLYAGRGMAKIMSFVMMVFALVPAIAPLMGAAIIGWTGWRGIFLAFVVFAVVVTTWLGVRQPETLPTAARRPLRARMLWSAMREVLGNRMVVLAIMVQGLALGMLFGVLSSTQQVFDQTFDKADTFPLWFGGIAVVAASASLLNARLVERLGMHLIVRHTVMAQIFISATAAALWMFAGLSVPALFAVFIVWKASVFFQAGLTIGNVNAMAMLPMGHIAGMAGSVIGFSATLAGALIAVPVGMAFNGTPVPMMLGVAVCAIAARALMAVLPRSADMD